MLKSEALKAKLEQAQLLATLESNPAWQIIRANAEAMIEMRRDALCVVGLPEDKTAQFRFELNILRWLLKSTQLATPDQMQSWQEDLAFQEKMEKMRVDAGLPPDAKELPR